MGISSERELKLRAADAFEHGGDDAIAARLVEREGVGFGEAGAIEQIAAKRRLRAWTNGGTVTGTNPRA